MTKRCVPAEVTLMAFGRDAETGASVVVDVVTTSRKHAYGFVRLWYRDADIIEIAALPPDKGLGDATFARTIYRSQG